MPVAQSDDGARISYETSGNGSLPLVLLHGWGGSASYWREMVSHLDLAGLRVIAPSYRGHGDSDKPATVWSIAELLSAA
jgi:pimeloyl-ACP methyl ester carboxylesterase